MAAVAVAVWSDHAARLCEAASGQTSFCIATERLYERIIEQLKNLIPLASLDSILLDFEAAARSAFSDGYPNSVVLGCLKFRNVE